MLLERFQFYIKHSINDLRVNPQRSVFGIFCIAAGVAAIVSLLTLGVMIEDTLFGSLQESNRGDIQLLPFGFEGDIEANERGAERTDIVEDGMFTDDGLAAIEAWLTDWYAENDPNTDDPFEITYRIGTDIGFITSLDGDDDRSAPIAFPYIVDTSAYPLYGEVRTDDGQSLDEMIDADAYGLGQDIVGTVVLSQNLAEDMNASVNEDVNISFGGDAYKFRVAGIVDTQTESSFQNFVGGIFGYFYIDITSQEIFPDLAGSYSNIYIKLKDTAFVDQVGDGLESDFPFMDVITTTELEEQNADLSTFVTQLVSVMGLVSMLIGGIGIVNTMLVVVRRRTDEIAVLKTLGLQPTEITWLFLIESILMGIIGSIIGIFLGFVTVFALKGVAEVFLIQNLSFRIAPVPVMTGFVVGILVTTIFGFLPILSAGQVRPATVLRPQDTVVPKAGRLRSFAALLVVIIALSIIAQGMLGGLLNDEDSDSLQELSSYIVAGLGILIALAMLLGGIFSGWTRNNPALKYLRWVLLLSVLPAAGYVLGTQVSAVILIAVVFIVAAVLYVVLWLLIWLTGRFFTSIIDFPFMLLGRIIPRIRDFAPSSRFVDLKISLRAMLSTKSRGASMLLALAIGVFTLSLITMLVSTIKNAIEEQMVDFAGGALYVISGGGDSNSFEQVVDRLEAGIDGVDEYGFIRSYEVRFVSFTNTKTDETYDEARLRRENRDEDYVDEFMDTFEFLDARSVDATLPSADFAEGRQLEPSDLYNNVVVIPADSVVVSMGVENGDLLTLQFVSDGDDVGEPVTFEVVGMTEEDEFGAIGSRVYAPLDFLPEGETFEVQPEQLTAVVDADEEDIPSVRRELKGITGVFVIDTRFFNDVINKVLAQFTNFPILVAALALVTGGVVIANSVALSMMERRREIAIMKAVGLARRRVLGMLLMENGIMGFIGGLMGVGISTLILYLLLRFAFGNELGTGIPYGTAFLLMGLCILIALVASMFSVFSAASEKPLNVLRYE